MSRLITLATIKTEKIDLSRSWILAEVAAGRFPKPCVRGNPNLWSEAEVDEWLAGFIARGCKSGCRAEQARAAKARRSVPCEA